MTDLNKSQDHLSENEGSLSDDEGLSPEKTKLPAKSVVPSERQEAILFATVMTDGWLELLKGGKNPRVGLQQKEKSLVLQWMAALEGFFTPKAAPGLVLKTPPGGTKALPQHQIRTRALPCLHPLLEAFGLKDMNKITPKPKKVVPPFDYIMQHLSYESLAWMFMFDGSKKSDHGRQMELHIQGFSCEEQKRLCIALYKKLGIKCWPSYYGKSESGQEQCHVQVSGLSLPLIKEKVEPFMFLSSRYKVPILTAKEYTSEAQSPWPAFYNSFKDLPEYKHQLSKFD